MTNPSPVMNYDRVAGIYDSTRGWPPGVTDEIAARLYALLTLDRSRDRPLRVLEVGAGTGRALVPLAAQGAWTVGADVSAEMLGLLIAKRIEQGLATPYAVLADAHQLPFPAARFDAVLLVHILHLVGDWQQVLDEVERVLDPSGAIALGLDEGESSDEAWIGARWAVLVREAGGTLEQELPLSSASTTAAPPARPDRQAVTRLAAACLAEHGWTVHEHTLARWTGQRTPADWLRRYAERWFSSSWHLPDAVLDAAVAGLRAALLAHYGTLDVPLPYAASFHLLLARRVS